MYLDDPDIDVLVAVKHRVLPGSADMLLILNIVVSQYLQQPTIATNVDWYDIVTEKIVQTVMTCLDCVLVFLFVQVANLGLDGHTEHLKLGYQ